MSFQITAIILICIWSIGTAGILLSQLKEKFRRISEIIILTGIALMIVYIVQLWIGLERAPMRTLGETRLWYVLFMALIGIIIYYRWKYWWIIPYVLFLSVVFLIVNIIHPDNFDKTLMPALQSYWFVPHVIVYMISYALLGVSMLMSAWELLEIYRGRQSESILSRIDNVVYIGFAFLTFGLLFGALWAKEAWGHYWTWDPKETWAFITWMLYLLYIHFRIHNRNSSKKALWILSLAFVVLIICWFGINYLPSAQNSVHVYGR